MTNEESDNREREIELHVQQGINLLQTEPTKVFKALLKRVVTLDVPILLQVKDSIIQSLTIKVLQDLNENLEVESSKNLLDKINNGTTTVEETKNKIILFNQEKLKEVTDLLNQYIIVTPVISNGTLFGTIKTSPEVNNDRPTHTIHFNQAISIALCSFKNLERVDEIDLEYKHANNYPSETIVIDTIKKLTDEGNKVYKASENYLLMVNSNLFQDLQLFNKKNVVYELDYNKIKRNVKVIKYDGIESDLNIVLDSRVKSFISNLRNLHGFNINLVLKQKEGQVNDKYLLGASKYYKESF